MPTAILALVRDPHDVFNVPLLKLLPECNQKYKDKHIQLSSKNAPGVSAGIFNYTLLQDVVTEKDLEILLLLSWSFNSTT